MTIFNSTRQNSPWNLLIDMALWMNKVLGCASATRVDVSISKMEYAFCEKFQYVPFVFTR